MSHEVAVRDAAAKLHAEILAAQAAGYRVAYPSLLDGLLSIAVSETAKVAQTDTQQATFGSPRRTAKPPAE